MTKSPIGYSLIVPLLLCLILFLSPVWYDSAMEAAGGDGTRGAASRRSDSFSVAATPATQASVLANSGFERGIGGFLAAWSLAPDWSVKIPDSASGVHSQRHVLVVWEKRSAAEGARCLRMESQGESVQDWALVGSQPLSLVPGYRYRISFQYRAEGLMPEDARREKYAALIMDLFVNKRLKGYNRLVKSFRIITFTNTKQWVRLSKVFTVPEEKDCWSQVRLSLINKCPGGRVCVWFDDLSLMPLDAELINPGFEEGADKPRAWKPFGVAKTQWVTDPTRTGKRAVLVANAGAGAFAGWATVVPSRRDRRYAFGGYVKARNMKPNGPVAGGAFCIQFLNSEDQPVSDQILSPAVANSANWRQVTTPLIKPPVGATRARLVAGLQFCRGTAFFDDLFLHVEEIKVSNIAQFKRKVPNPSKDVFYLPNLLKNGTVEVGESNQPAGWTYVGSSERDWKQAEIEAFHTQGYPPFSIGRGRGEWAHGLCYAGSRSLLNVSIDPPLSSRHQWYGRGVVDGYWLSDPMPCEPGRAYMAAAWVRPGRKITEAWHGPLELRFYDAKGHRLRSKNFVRSSLAGAAAGVWTFWPTQPHIAPQNAVAMRLRFGQELKADAGGWGRTYADNFAVWRLPDCVPPQTAPQLNTEKFMQWFFRAHQATRPPYLPAPTTSPGYTSCWGRMENLTDGNLFFDPQTPIPARFSVYNLLGESRTLRLRITRTDWLGNAAKPLETEPFDISGYGEAAVDLAPAPVNRYGAFHLDIEVLEGGVVMGRFAGRYAVIPPPLRPHTVENIWGVTPLIPIKLDGSPTERELATLMKMAGFGMAWVRVYFTPETARQKLHDIRRVLQWYRSLGIRPVLQLIVRPRRPVQRQTYERMGEIVGEEARGLAVAIGNWGIETANSESPFRGGKDRLTDQEYDTILAGLYDGVKSVAPELPVLIGNIATDPEAKTIKRLYGPPAKGRFDGAIFNAYMGQLTVGQNMLGEFDRHGDTLRTIWLEEMAEQRSPFAGEQRRYGEADGAKQMLRTWLTLYTKLRPRLKAITMWGFVTRSRQDIMMVTPNLQPRPQFVAHAVMADALADATFAADLSHGNVAAFEFQRPARPGLPPFNRMSKPTANLKPNFETLLAAWATAGEADLTLDVPTGQLAAIDLMGNCTSIRTNAGIAVVHLDTTPVYLIARGELRLSKRIQVTLNQGSEKINQPRVHVTVMNTGTAAVAGTLTVAGSVIEGKRQRSISLSSGKRADVFIGVKRNIPLGERTPFRAVFRTDRGAVYAASAALNFAFAVRTKTPPALDGTWTDWGDAPVVPFGTMPAQISKPTVTGESYEGRGDVLGRFRLLWDNQFLYIGVEAADDAFVSQPKRGMSGFMGDSIEFAIQPQNALSQSANRYEFEFYLPAGESSCAASRRSPLPSIMVTHWQAIAKPTGHRGDVNYQVAVPWRDIGVTNPHVGQTISFALVLNDKDNTKSPWSGGRCRIHWFAGIDNEKNPERYGDVTLVEK